MDLIKPDGFIVYSNLSGWGSANQTQHQGRDAFLLDAAGTGGGSAIRIIGEASKYWTGSLARLIVLNRSTDATATLTVWDSNDTAVSTNKRGFTISLYAAPDQIGEPIVLPIEWRFTDGLCALVVDPANEARILFQLTNLNKFASAFH